MDIKDPQPQEDNESGNNNGDKFEINDEGVLLIVSLKATKLAATLLAMGSILFNI